VFAAAFASPMAHALPPIANPDSFSIASGLGDSSTSGPHPISVLANDTDPEGDLLTIVSVTQPGLGSVDILPDGSDVTFSADITRGISSFTYTIDDGNGGQAVGTVSVEVTNRSPNGCDQQVTVESGVIFQDILVVNCGSEPPDPEGDDVQIVSFTQAANGTVTQLDTVAFQYQSDPGYTGSDSFQFTIEDTFGAQASATVTIDVTPFVNGAPVAQDDTATTRSGPSAGEQVAIDVLVNDSDPDQQPLEIVGSTGPLNGNIDSISPSGLIRYTPDPGFSGDDGFSYTVDDGAGGTDTASVTIHVAADAVPVANDDVASTGANALVQILVLQNDTDADDTLAYNDIELTQPANGFVEQSCLGNCNPPEYTPNPGFSGQDSFTYTITDSLGAVSNMATVTINVSAAPTPPTAVNDVASTFKDAAITINVLDNDTSAATVATVTQPNHGGTTAILSNQTQIQYTPPSGFRGTETFQYEAENANGRDTATVTVTVQNRVPVATDDTASTTAGLTVTIPVLSNDVDDDGDALQITNANQGSNGTVSVVGATVEYTPDSGFIGTDSFSYSIDDQAGGVATATVTVDVVAGSNAPPTAVIAGGDRTIADSNGAPGELVDFDGSASFDPDGEITCGSWTVNGVVQDIACTTTAQFALNDGVNTVTLVVTDDGNPQAQSAPTSVTITVGTTANQPPVAAIAGGNRSVGDTDGTAGETVTFDGSASSDADGDVTSYQWMVNGLIVSSATGPTPALRLDDGVNTVALTVTDNDGDRSAPDAVTITVESSNAGPTVTIEGGNRSVPDGDDTPGELVAFRGSATDPNGVDTASFRWIVNDAPVAEANGDADPTLALAQGNNTVTLTAADSQGAIGSDTVTVTIGEPNAIADLPGLTPNQQSTANATEDTCSRLLKADPASLTEEERNLRATCNTIFANADNTQAVTQALDQISGTQITSQQTTAIDFGMTQLLNIGARLEALRMGTHGFTTAGLNVSSPGVGVPMSALASLGKLLLGEGGGSGDDDGEGGLLDKRLGIFINGAVRWGDKDRTDRETGFEFESHGVTIGADYRFTDSFVGGLALGYAKGDTDFDDDGGSQDSDGYSGTAYGTWYSERSYFDWIATYGTVGYDSVRNINITSMGITDRAFGDTDAGQWALGLGTGYDFGKGAFRIGPTLAVNYVHIDVDGFTETAEGTSGLAMRFDDQSAESLTAKIGGQLSYSLSRKWGILTPQARFELVREFKNESQKLTVHYSNDPFVDTPDQPSSGFVIFTDEPDENYFNWAVGLSATFANGLSGFIDYESVESLDTITMQELSIGLRYETKFR
jgi:uncharacterized protein YhjY with autotransporter beta-barrel domain